MRKSYSLLAIPTITLFLEIFILVSIMSWSISIKIVGGSRDQCIHQNIIGSVATDEDTYTNNTDTRIKGANSQNTANKKPQPTIFTLKVQPDDSILSLHKKIEEVTGLKCSQQRLIFRGRLVGAFTQVRERTGDDDRDIKEKLDSRIRDVDGLGDGQTIHLFPRPNTLGQVVDPGLSENNISLNNEDDEGRVISSSGTGLLAALLGLGSESPSDDVDNSDEINNGENISTPSPRPNPGSIRTSTSRRRMENSHRRTVDDPKYPEPGSLEPIRQGLLTLHTMLGSIGSTVRPVIDEKTSTGTTQNYKLYSHGTRDNVASRLIPPQISRKWYRGQWLDFRDTVNQWLEATIMEIVEPVDILITPIMNETCTNKENKKYIGCKSVHFQVNDPTVSACDFSGRKKLLLEPCVDMNDDTLASLNGDDELVGYRERDSNDHVQLLLVHYNGWPSRWDEWIRGDSERLRPFRTRSKYQPGRGGGFTGLGYSSAANPIPQSIFRSSPPTLIRDEDDAVERNSIFPELFRVMAAINILFVRSMHNIFAGNNMEAIIEKFQSIKENRSNLPWVNESFYLSLFDSSGSKPWKVKKTNKDSEKHYNRKDYINVSKNTEDLDNQNYSCSSNKEDSGHIKFDKHVLEALSPMLDRLGRVLTDAAPHVAAIAESLHNPSPSDSQSVKCKVKTINSESVNSNVINELLVSCNNDRNNSISSSSFGYAIDDTSASVPLLSNTTSSERSTIYSQEDEYNQVCPNNAYLDPDYADFVNGFINSAFTGERSSTGRVVAQRMMLGSNSNAANLGTSLLSAYLSSSGVGDVTNSANGEDVHQTNQGGVGQRIFRIDGETATRDALGNRSDFGDSGDGAGSNGAGIDIHIHAIMTGPGGIGGGEGNFSGTPGLLHNSMPSVATTSTSLPQNMLLNSEIPDVHANSSSHFAENRTVSVNLSDNDDIGLFSDLYSDTPLFHDTTNILSTSCDVNEISEEVSNKTHNDVQILSNTPSENNTLSIGVDENSIYQSKKKSITEDDSSSSLSSSHSPITGVNQDINDTLSVSTMSVSATVVVSTCNGSNVQIPHRGISRLFHWNHQV